MNHAEKVLLILFIYAIVTSRATKDEAYRALLAAIAITAAILFVAWP